jgi:hypothetical protein
MKGKCKEKPVNLSYYICQKIKIKIKHMPLIKYLIFILIQIGCVLAQVAPIDIPEISILDVGGAFTDQTDCAVS